MIAAVLAGLTPMASCASQPATVPDKQASGTAAPKPGSLRYDQIMFHELLDEHTKIRRLVRHTDKGVETLTESDDPAIAAKITEHAVAMQTRMESGARLRVWDPVFAELFAKHGEVTIEVTPTPKGVKIVEFSDDPETMALLRAHAMGVSEFVREGRAAAARPTPRFKAGDPLPLPELAIGGVPHRFVLSQPDADQLASLKASGVDVVVSFRKPAEQPDFDEKAVTAATGIEYCNLPYRGAGELTDELLDSARAAIKAADEKGEVAALHCRTGNRVGPGWAAYRVLDKGVPLEQAISEAKAMQMIDPALEIRTREYILIRMPEATKPAK